MSRPESDGIVVVRPLGPTITLPRIAVSVLTMFIALISTTCKSTSITDVYTPKEWREILGTDGWVPLPLPDSKYRPGSIIQVNDDGVRWITHLESCRYPADVTDPVPGTSPNITFSKKRRIDAELLGRMKGISAGPSFETIKNATLQVREHGADSFDLGKFLVWLEDPDNRDSVSEVCMNMLKKPDHYLVTESFRVSKGEYTLYDKTGAAIELDAPALEEILDLEVGGGAEWTNEGTLVIEVPVYFAVRRAVRVGDDWQTLSDPDELETADAQIGKLFVKSEDES